VRHKKINMLFIAIILAVNAAVPVVANAADPELGWQSAKQIPLSIQAAKPAASEYRLSRYDVLNIVIVGFPDDLLAGSQGQTSGLSNVMIGPDGYVNLPYAGSVKMAGLTVAEATDILTEKLSEYIKIPSMAVIVKQYGPRKVYIMGEVGKQGIFTLDSEYMNLFAAISSAGGIAKRGRPKHIAVVRMVDGKVQMQEVNFDRFIEKQDASQNPRLQDGDMIYVPRSNKVDLYEDIMPMINAYWTFKTIFNN
jgi:polysaccharide export outer membrane protein